MSLARHDEGLPSLILLLRNSRAMSRARAPPLFALSQCQTREPGQRGLSIATLCLGDFCPAPAALNVFNPLGLDIVAPGPNQQHLTTQISCMRRTTSFLRYMLRGANAGLKEVKTDDGEAAASELMAAGVRATTYAIGAGKEAVFCCLEKFVGSGSDLLDPTWRTRRGGIMWFDLINKVNDQGEVTAQGGRVEQRDVREREVSE
ncbi:hypothetical protein EDB83DRAFT_2323039 [Lactarius deliciosus]|nr:hypothetical protein EDB83DRAFT_2323039 [Lactarius deliciosus]